MGFPHRLLLDSSPEDHNLPFTVIIPIVFVSTFLILSCYYFNIVWFFRRRGRTDVLEAESNQEERLNEEQSQVDHPIWHIRTIGLDESIINSIVICNYKKGEGLIETTDCAVCLTEFNENESLRLLPNCNHAFHVSCIDTWLRSHVSCPLCRSHILSRSQSTQIASTTPSLSHEEEQTNSQVNVDFESESESERRDSFGEDQNSDEGTSSKCESSLVNPINCVEISISENHGNGENDRDFQTVRRSMSMDSCFTRSTMTIIDSNKEEDDDKDDDDEEEEEKRIPEHFNLVELQEKEVFAKITENKKALDPGNNSSMRSFSSSRKLVFLRQGRSSNSILPL